MDSSNFLTGQDLRKIGVVLLSKQISKNIIWNLILTSIVVCIRHIVTSSLNLTGTPWLKNDVLYIILPIKNHWYTTIRQNLFDFMNKQVFYLLKSLTVNRLKFDLSRNCFMNHRLLYTAEPRLSESNKTGRIPCVYICWV